MLSMHTCSTLFVTAAHRLQIPPSSAQLGPSSASFACLEELPTNLQQVAGDSAERARTQIHKGACNHTWQSRANKNCSPDAPGAHGTIEQPSSAWLRRWGPLALALPSRHDAGHRTASTSGGHQCTALVSCCSSEDCVTVSPAFERRAMREGHASSFGKQALCRQPPGQAGHVLSGGCLPHVPIAHLL